MMGDFNQKDSSEEAQLFQWIRKNSKSGDRFLIPVHLESFRTNTLKPIYVDFFAIPYSSPDVINWYHRVLAANKFYDTNSCNELFNIQYDGQLTHIIVEKDHIQPDCENLELVYEDEYFLTYQISGYSTGL